MREAFRLPLTMILSVILSVVTRSGLKLLGNAASTSTAAAAATAKTAATCPTAAGARARAEGAENRAIATLDQRRRQY